MPSCPDTSTAGPPAADAAAPLLDARQAAGLPVVLVLASGRGERFLASGGRGPKLQADLAGRSVLQRTLDTVRASGLRWHLEDAGHPGMGDSIAAAARATDAAQGWMVLPADLPLLRADTLVRLAFADLQADALVPWHAGQRGHPVRFAAACGDDLRALRGPQGAASVLARRKVQRIEVDDPGCVFDIDTMDDLQRAHEFLAPQGGGSA